MVGALAATPATSVGAEMDAGAYSLASSVANSTVWSPMPCRDKSYSLTGARWTQTLAWSFNAASTPSSMGRSATRSAIKRSFSNIVNGRNTCGRTDRIAATAKFLGKTASAPGCTVMDNKNVVGFVSLPLGVLAQTCWWTISGRIVEADIQINSRLPWATATAGCVDAYMLEAVMTHEVGHAFGVGHVSETSNGRLTMSTSIDGMCNNHESRLGIGDLLALEKLY
jgi:hypothetical protein